ncbi:SRPBCC family protein [bacterium]|nr:SRPBCC family protein [bacterium]
MAEVNHVETFNCTPQEFFNILKDYEKYPEFLKEVKSCKVIEDNGKEKTVEYKVSVVKEFSYLNQQFENEPNTIHWKFIKGDLFKKMEGGWKLEDVGGKTKATYIIRAEFSMFVPGMIVKTVLSANLPAMMRAYHQRVKDVYGK